MGFCTKCGAQTDVNGVCPNCGPMTAVEQPNFAQMTYASQAMSQRSQSLNQIDSLITYFGAISNAYDRYDAADEVHDTWAGKKTTPLVVIGIILLFFGAVDLIAFIVIAIVNKTSIFNVSKLGLGVFAGGLVLLLIGISTKKKRAKFLAESEATMAETTLEIKAHYDAYYDCPIGIEYSNPKILDAIKSMIQSGRADTIMGAINQILDDLHKEEMLQLAQDTKMAAEDAASSARSAAIWSAADFLTKK